MRAVVYEHTEEIHEIEVQDRFDFEDRFLSGLVPPRPCKEYRDHHPSPQGVHVFLHPVSQSFEARPYLEFAKEIHNKTHFRVMQEGQPTAFTIILG